MGQTDRLRLSEVKSCVLFIVNITAPSITHVFHIEWYSYTCITNWIECGI